MRHLITHNRDPYKPKPSFDWHSKFLVGTITIFYPLLALFCLKATSAITKELVGIFTNLSELYPDGTFLGNLDFTHVQEVRALFMWVMIFLVVTISLFAGILEIFRIKGYFWMNFYISIALLIIGIIIFAPNFFSLTEY